MRRALIAALLASSGGVAIADDPRDIFGLKPKPAAPTCTDPHTLGCVFPEDPFDPLAPMALRTWLPSSYLLTLPVADSTQFDVAHFAVGASRDDAGPAFGGATGLENTWTLDGAPVENPRNGQVETRIPLMFANGLTVLAGGYGARDRAGLGGSIDVELRRADDKAVFEAYAWTGITQSARERPIAPQTYQLRRLTTDDGPDVAFAAVHGGPWGELAGGKVWTLGGLAGHFSTTDVTWRAARLVDANHDGVIDGLPGVVALDPIETTSERATSYLIPYIGRVGWTRGPHDLVVSLVGDVQRDALFLANATQQAAGIDRDTLVADGIVTYKGTWRDTHLRAQLAWHRTDRHESARDATAGKAPQLLSAYVPRMLAEDPALAAACDDTNDPAPDIPNCPIPFGFFASGGAGQLVDSVGDRPVATAELAHRLGDHVLRAGATLEDTRLVNTTRFTGGSLVRSLFEGHTDTARFIAGDCGDDPASPCATSDHYEVDYRTRYTAAYLEDTIVASPDVRVDGGLRYELMWVGTRLHFSHELSPRLGFAWNLFGQGDQTSRWWASYGRTHALLDAGMGTTVIARNQIVRDIEFAGGVDRTTDRGNVFSVCHVDDPTCTQAIAPATQDEVATGIELGVIRALRAGVWLQHRTLRQGLDTVLAKPDGEAFVDNPGRDGSIAALRDTTILAADLMIAPTPKTTLRVTYLWGTAHGSWVGPFDPRQGVTQYAGTDWDLDAENLYGRLPSDPGQRVAIEVVRRGSIGKVELAAATRVFLQTGKPEDVLGQSDDLGVVQLLPRGSIGRGPMLSQVNARLQARWRAVDLFLDVFNAWNRREATGFDPIYAGGVVHPIVGGSYQDLVWLRDENCGDTRCSSAVPRLRTTFGQPTGFQTPRSFVLGARISF